jgi:hypothetical protein
MGQERRIGHVRGMSAEPSQQRKSVLIGDIGSWNGPHSPARAGGFAISLMSNDGEIRFRLLRVVVESEL